MITHDQSGDAAPEVENGLDVQTRAIDNVVVLAVRGELDAFTAPRLAQAIGDGIDAARAGIVVDLSQLVFLASAGMYVLLRGHHAAAAAFKRFSVVADGPATSGPMKVIGLDQELSLYPTLECAMREPA